MFSRTVKRSLVDLRIASFQLPPTFLLPIRPRCFNTTTQHVESPPDHLEPSQIAQLPTKPISTKSSQSQAKPVLANTVQPVHTGRSAPQPPAPPTEPVELSSSVKELLPLLAVQPAHYISAHIHGKPYLVTAGDVVRLPFRMPGVVPGDVLRLNRASSLGSRDYTLKGSPYVDERLFECRARVMGTEAEPMRIKEKKKRRNRRIKTVKSKHKYTILRIAELKVKNLEEVEGALD